MTSRPASAAVIAAVLTLGTALSACEKKNPPATVVAAQPAAPTSRDDTSTRPRGDMTPAEESNSMPKAGQVNNHSSPSFEGKASGAR